MLAVDYKPLNTLNETELRELVFIQVNPFKFTSRLLNYLREAQDEYFKRLCNKK
jgi:hypothetical protein